MKPPFIYFLKPVGMVGPIKIGITNNPERRLQWQNHASPFRLEIIVKAPGSLVLERNIHDCFMDAHSHSEWFHPIPRLLRTIERIQAGVPIEQAIDLTKRLGSLSEKMANANRLTPQNRRRQGYYSRLYHARDRVERESGVYHPALPEDVLAIMRRWSGAQQPTPDEFARLEQVIAAPAEHFGRPNAPTVHRQSDPGDEQPGEGQAA